jgi:toluene monooxygenase electron transfer component
LHTAPLTVPDGRPDEIALDEGRRQHRIRIKDSDVSFLCGENDSLLRAALRAGLGHPYECNSGGCGSCLVDLVEGEIVDHWPDAPGISSRSRARGRRLACQSSPVTDCSIAVRLRTGSEPAVIPVRQQVKLIEARSLTRDMTMFVFESELPATFIAGQYALLHLPEVSAPRAYSMSNLPNNEGRWAFIVKKVPNGKGTEALFKMDIGSRLELDGPYGMAYLRHDTGRDIVCVGGGSGLSPLMSILSAAAREPSFASRSISLFYGGRTAADICVDELIRQDSFLPDRVRCVTAISNSDGDDGWAGERGFIHQSLQRWMNQGHDPKNYDFYFCGPPPMTSAVQQLLFDSKVPFNQIYFDRFL